MKIYIAGKITGDPDYKKRFDAAEALIAKMGHAVMNPARLEAYEDFTWEDYMDVSGAMLRVCDAVFFLEGWEDSRGARAERQLADERGMKAYFALCQLPPVRKKRKGGTA